MKKVAERRKKRKQSKRNAVVIGIAGSAAAILGGFLIWIFFLSPDAIVMPSVDSRIDFREQTKEQILTLLDHDKFYPGVSINDVNISGLTKAEVLEKFTKSNSDMPEFAYTIQMNGQSDVLDSSKIHTTSDIESVMDIAFLAGREADMSDVAEDTSEETRDDIYWSRRYASYMALQASPVRYELNYMSDVSSLELALQEMLEEKQMECVDAAVVDFDMETNTFVISEDQTGMEIDIDDAIAQLDRLVEAEAYEGLITVQTMVTEPEVTAEYLSSVMGYINKATSKCKKDSNRNTNIRLICEIIDGLILQPGEYFDFNERVGKRTAERGFKEAGAIISGDDGTEMGGGICQANSMIYHCALMAELQIDKRRPHSYPSDYLSGTGIDATVSWGGPEFRFTNTSDYPIVLRADFTDPMVTVEVYGRQRDDGLTIKIVGEVKSSESLENTYIADPTLLIGKTETDKKPRNRINAECWQVYYDKDGNKVNAVKAADSYYAGRGAEIRVGVLAPDGQHGTLDTKTGVVTPPEPLPTEPPVVTPEPTPDPNTNQDADSNTNPDTNQDPDVNPDSGTNQDSNSADVPDADTTPGEGEG